MNKEITYIGTKRDACEEIRVLNDRATEILPMIRESRPVEVTKLVDELIGIRRIQMKLVEQFLLDRKNGHEK